MNKYPILLLIIILSCSLMQKSININPLFIQKLSENKLEVERGLLPSIMPQYLFARGVSDSILLIEDYRILEEIYESGLYKFSYEDFLRLAFNQEIILKPQFSVSKFCIDKRIALKYHSENFDDFFYSYCKKNSIENSYYLQMNISDNERNTVMYYLFINNFITSFNDYSGKYSVKNIIDYIQNK